MGLAIILWMSATVGATTAWPYFGGFGLLAIATAGILSWAIGGLVVGLVVTIVSLVSSSRPRLRILLVLTPLVAMGSVVTVYIAMQVRRHIQTGVEWPNGFLFADQSVMIAVGCVVAECLLRLAVRTRPTTE